MVVSWTGLASRCAVAALVLALSSASVAAQRVSEARLRDLVAQAEHITAGRAEQRSGGAATVPGATDAASADRGRPLTLDEAVKAALDRNLAIAVARLQPSVNDLAYTSVWSTYQPVLTSTLGTQSTATPSTSTIGGGGAAASVATGQTTWNGGLAQNLPWGGASYSVSVTNSRATTNSTVALYNPAYNAVWQAQFTQPLSRNRRTDATRQQLAITKINRDITDVQLKATITNTVANVREAYWNFVYTVDAVDVAQQQLNHADQLVTDNQTRERVGVMTPLDVVTAQSQAATAAQNLVVAQAAMRTSELSLKQLIVGDTRDPLWSTPLNPVDRPGFAPADLDVRAAIRRALDERTDIDILRKTVQSNDTTLRYLTNQLLPQADLIVGYGLAGLGGTELVRTGSGVVGSSSSGSSIASTIPGGYGDALASLTNYPRWNVGLAMNYPLGMSAQKVAVSRARVQQNQVDAQIKQIELQVATEITSAAISVRANLERVQAAQAARRYAQQALDAEQAKFRVGLSTNYLVIQQQNALATAQNNELQAQLNYRISLEEWDRLQHTTLNAAGITVINTATTSVR